MRTTRREPLIAARPAPIVSFLVLLAAQVQPGGSKRARYLQEFRAELSGMPRRSQPGYALRVLGSSWTLRSASANPYRERRTIMMILRSKPLLCLLNIRHHWVVLRTEDGGNDFQRCSKCGKDRLDFDWGIDLDKGMSWGG